MYRGYLNRAREIIDTLIEQIGDYDEEGIPDTSLMNSSYCLSLSSSVIGDLLEIAGKNTEANEDDVEQSSLLVVKDLEIDPNKSLDELLTWAYQIMGDLVGHFLIIIQRYNYVNVLPARYLSMIEGYLLEAKYNIGFEITHRNETSWIVTGKQSCRTTPIT